MSTCGRVDHPERLALWTQGRLPTQAEWEAQWQRLRRLETLDYDREREQWQAVMRQCAAFEAHYM
jgi:hypothetical protein